MVRVTIRDVQTTVSIMMMFVQKVPSCCLVPKTWSCLSEDLKLVAEGVYFCERTQKDQTTKQTTKFLSDVRICAPLRLTSSAYHNINRHYSGRHKSL